MKTSLLLLPLPLGARVDNLIQLQQWPDENVSLEDSHSSWRFDSKTSKILGLWTQNILLGLAPRAAERHPLFLQSKAWAIGRVCLLDASGDVKGAEGHHKCKVCL